MTDDVRIADVHAARHSIIGVARRTPTLPSATLRHILGSDVVVKAENLQRTGAFKLRGALNKLANLPPADALEAPLGVVTGSAGNHAQGLAFAAQHAGVPCEIVVPVGAPISKIEACEGYGAVVHEHGASLAEAVAHAHQIEAERGHVFCPPFDDPFVVAGQGTIGLEIVEDVSDLATIVVPLGGGGLASGIAIAAKTLVPHARVIGVQAATCAPYCGQAVPDGPVDTLADGIAVKYPGAVTGPLIERWLDDIVTVDEDAIADAMVLLMERAKLYVEGAGAVGVAAVLTGAVTADPRGTTCVVLSGGNVDLGVVPGLIRRHEQTAGRRLAVFSTIDDRPGSLARLLEVFATGGADLIAVEHIREGVDLSVRQTAVSATFAVRSPAHSARLLNAAAAAGYDLRVTSGALERPDVPPH